MTVTKGRVRARRKFLRYFPDGFADETYFDWERGYKWRAHEAWWSALNRKLFTELLARGAYTDIASAAVRIESRTNLLFSFEKMALRDAVRGAAGAEGFARGLHRLLYGKGKLESRFEGWCEAIAALPRRQTRVLTWPLVTVFPFLAEPEQHIFLKPAVTRVAARRYAFDFNYVSRPSWTTFRCLLDFAEQVRRDQADLAPRDMIDLQSFIWVQGSDEYP